MMTDLFLAYSILASDPSKHSVPSSHSQDRPVTVWFVSQGRQIIDCLSQRSKWSGVRAIMQMLQK